MCEVKNMRRSKDTKPNFKMERRFEMVDLDRQEAMDRASANIHYQMAKNFTEQDAEATIKAMVEVYPGLVMKILSKKYVKNLATLDAMHTFLKDWSES
jgi:hypothetical protein